MRHKAFKQRTMSENSMALLILVMVYLATLMHILDEYISDKC